MADPAYFSSKVPMDSQGLIIGHASTGRRDEMNVGKNCNSIASFFLEEILKDRYAENVFNKLVLQTFKG